MNLTKRERTNLLRAGRWMRYHRNIGSREELVSEFDAGSDFIGSKGIGPVYGRLLRRAIAEITDPYTWSDLTGMAWDRNQAVMGDVRD